MAEKQSARKVFRTHGNDKRRASQVHSPQVTNWQKRQASITKFSIRQCECQDSKIIIQQESVAAK